jgi:hypothetical protein
MECDSSQSMVLPRLVDVNEKELKFDLDQR